MGASRPFGRAIRSSNSRRKLCGTILSARSGRNAVARLPHMLWRSPPYVAFLVCRIERENSSAAWDSDRRRLSVHIESRCVRRCRHLALTCRTQGYGARCPSPRPAPYAVSAASRSGVRAKRSSVRSIMVRTDLQILRAIVVPRLPIDRQA